MTLRVLTPPYYHHDPVALFLGQHGRALAQDPTVNLQRMTEPNTPKLETRKRRAPNEKPTNPNPAV